MADEDNDMQQSADDILETDRDNGTDQPLAFPGSSDDPAAPPDDVPDQTPPMGLPSTDDPNDATETYQEGN